MKNFLDFEQMIVLVDKGLDCIDASYHWVQSAFFNERSQRYEFDDNEPFRLVVKQTPIAIERIILPCYCLLDLLEILQKSEDRPSLKIWDNGWEIKYDGLTKRVFKEELIDVLYEWLLESLDQKPTN